MARSQKNKPRLVKSGSFFLLKNILQCVKYKNFSCLVIAIALYYVLIYLTRLSLAIKKREGVAGISRASFYNWKKKGDCDQIYLDFLDDIKKAEASLVVSKNCLFAIYLTRGCYELWVFATLQAPLLRVIGNSKSLMTQYLRYRVRYLKT